MMIKGHRAIEIGQGNTQRLGNREQRLFGKITVAIMKSMKDWQQRGGFSAPLVDQRVIGRHRHDKLRRMRWLIQAVRPLWRKVGKMSIYGAGRLELQVQAEKHKSATSELVVDRRIIDQSACSRL